MGMHSYVPVAALTVSSGTGMQDLIARNQFESVNKEAEDVPLKTQETHHNLHDSKNDDVSEAPEIPVDNVSEAPEISKRVNHSIASKSFFL